MIGQALVLNGDRVNTSEYKYRVSIPDNYSDGASDWLKNNIKRGWSIIYSAKKEFNKGHIEIVYCIGFMNDTDAMAFKLAWS